MQKNIDDKLRDARLRISQAALNANRAPAGVTLLAVSKGQQSHVINQAYRAGQRHFGENYLQEALTKIAELDESDSIWHFIGAIQSNKTRAIAENFHWVHTVDRLKIAKRLSAARPTYLEPLQICIQVNLEREASKSGVDKAQLGDLAREIAPLPGIKLRGLMCIPSKSARAATASPGDHPFLQLRGLYEKLKQDSMLCNMDTLSMGMSADYPEAIAAGATIVRVGTSIFGERKIGETKHATTGQQRV